MKLFFYLCLLVSVSFSYGQREEPVELDREIFEEVARISETINTVPEDHLLVEVGRSPAVFFEYLRAAYPERQTAQLPISSLRYYYPSKITNDLSEAELQEYAKYAGEQIGTQIEGKKAIVLVDYTVSGISVSNTAKIVDAYLESRGLDIPVKILHINSPDEPHISWSNHPSYRLSLGSQDSRLFMYLQHKSLAPYSQLKLFSFDRWKRGETKASDFFHDTEKSKYLRRFIREHLNTHSSKDKDKIKPVVFKKPILARVIDYCRLLLSKVF